MSSSRNPPARNLYLVLVLPGLLCGCSPVSPEHRSVPMVRGEERRLGSETAAVANPRRRRLGDPQLEDLIRRGFGGGPSRVQGMARRQYAQAGLRLTDLGHESEARRRYLLNLTSDRVRAAGPSNCLPDIDVLSALPMARRRIVDRQHDRPAADPRLNIGVGGGFDSRALPSVNPYQGEH